MAEDLDCVAKVAEALSCLAVLSSLPSVVIGHFSYALAQGPWCF